MSKSRCPCGLNINYEECCGLFINSQQLPVHPEQLMRSRYTAFTEANMDYIQKTMRGPITKNNDIEQTRQWAKEVKWLKLEVLHSEINSLDPNQGLVEFEAHYQQNHQPHVIHERSLFKKIEGHWFYIG